MALPAAYRVTAIGLERRRDRWEACEKHLQAILPPGIEFDMFPGSDAKMAASDAEDKVAALEAAMDCHIYRGWPITEVSDVRRCFPSLADQSDAMAWVGYERAVARAFRADRSRLYVDFFMRHVSFGDIGAALSHLRVAERAHAEDLELQIVFEDDSRPTADAVPQLLQEVAKLQRHGVKWDLIYLHSAHYGRALEPQVDCQSFADGDSSALHYAGHRRVCHAYALSRSGSRKIATCGLRASVFSIDDFLSALHAGHPRPDVMALPCVRRARGERAVRAEVGHGEDDADDTTEEHESDDEAGTSRPDDAPEERETFIGLTFRDDAGLCELPSQASVGGAAFVSLDSDSKVGHGSAVLLGDAGVQTLAHDDDEEEAAPEATDVDSAKVAVDIADGGASLMAPQPISWEALLTTEAAAAQAVAHELTSRSFFRLRMRPLDVDALIRAEAAAAAFFAKPQTYKRGYTGKGGRRDKLLLWGCGYGTWPHREQWHVVCGASDAMAWPNELIGAGSEGGSRAADGSGEQGAGDKLCAAETDPTLSYDLRAVEHLLRRVALASLSACADVEDTGGSSLHSLIRSVAASARGTDPSVLDAFWYPVPPTSPPASSAVPHKAEANDAERGMAAHNDPGVLTLTRASDVPGLEIWLPTPHGTASGTWVRVEALAAADEVLVFAGEQLEAATGGRVRAARHRVVIHPQEEGKAATGSGSRRCSSDDAAALLVSEGVPLGRNSVVFELRAPED